MHRHALAIWLSILIAIVIASMLGYIPEGPGVPELSSLDEAEFEKMFFDADPYLYRKVTFSAKVSSISGDMFADYIQVHLDPETKQKGIIVIVNRTIPDLQAGQIIDISGYVNGDLKITSQKGEVNSIPLVVGTSIKDEKIDNAVSSI